MVVADIIPKGRWAAGALGRKSDNRTSSTIYKHLSDLAGTAEVAEFEVPTTLVVLGAQLTSWLAD